MIVLDTNVVSEMMKPSPNARVTSWFAGQPRASLYTTSVTKAEILRGVLLLPAGKRRDGLRAASEAVFTIDLAGRVLAFDADAAVTYARISADRAASGRPIAQFDALVAAITRSRGAVIATRNVGDFEGCGIEVVDPWK